MSQNFVYFIEEFSICRFIISSEDELTLLLQSDKDKYSRLKNLQTLFFQLFLFANKIIDIGNKNLFWKTYYGKNKDKVEKFNIALG